MAMQEKGGLQNGRVHHERPLSPEEKRDIRDHFIADYFANSVPDETCNLTFESQSLRLWFSLIRESMAEMRRADGKVQAAKIIEQTSIGDMHEFAVDMHRSCRNRVGAQLALARVKAPEFDREELNRVISEAGSWFVKSLITEKTLALKRQKPRS